MRYSHTQRVPQHVLALAGAAGVAIGLTPPGLLARLFLLGVLGTAGVTFHSLTVEVDDKEVRLRFGGGLYKKSIPLADIKSATVVRTTPLQGWGIHYVGKGWLYNVYGLDAVELSLPGGKRAVIGTDEPQRLAAAISEALSLRLIAAGGD